MALDADGAKQVLNRRCIFLVGFQPYFAALPENAIWFELGLDVVCVCVFFRLTRPTDPIWFSPQAVIQEVLVEVN